MTYNYIFEIGDWKQNITKEVKSFEEKLDFRGIHELTTSFLDRDDVKFALLKHLEVVDADGKVIEKVVDLNKWQ